MYKSKQTRVGRIPDNWSAMRLQDGAEIGSGKSPQYTKGGSKTFDVIGSNGKIGLTDKVNFKSGIAVGRVGASGSVHHIKTPVWLSDNVLYVKPNPTIWNESFLYHALTQSRLPALASQTAQPLITQSDLGRIILPVPSLFQQNGIAEMLDSLDDTYITMENMVNKTELLRDVILDKLLTRGLPGYHIEWKEVSGIGNIPARWQVARLNEVSSISAGDPAPQGNQYFHGGKYSFVRTQDVGRVKRSRYFDKTIDKVNDKAVQEKSLHLWPKGTVLVPKSGASTLLNNRVCLSKPAYVSSHLAAILPHEDVSSLFLYYQLCRIDANRILRNPGYPSLSLADIGTIILAIPPLDEQQKIVSLLDSIDSTIDLSKEQIRRTIIFHRSLARELLTKLPPNDAKGRYDG